ncbi:MAG TPA: tRNA modification GTPase [Ohtaekwangia sp.]|nr:tRNA modification GTPase [Ohtaekwangia sp.]
MKKSLTVVFFLLSLSTAVSQIKFEKGYFIDKGDKKIECLIKNNDWSQNPSEIEYKSDENSASEHINVHSVEEFGIYNASKFVARTVIIDRSSSQLSALSMSANPIFKEERLFLKVLVEGKANLYYYEDRNVKRFFYNVDGSQIEQLIFKLYVASNKVGSSRKIGENNRFRQQLWNSLKCSSIEMKHLENLNYRKKDLINVFSNYNACSGSDVTTFEDKVKRQLFTISVRPRLNYSSLSADNALAQSNHFDFRKKTGIGIGIEGEFFLPMKKNKWSILLEPTYQTFNARTTAPDHSTPGGILIAQMDYKSIELPLGIRHYFFLSDKSRIFVNASFIFDFTASSSQINITRGSGYPLNDLDISGGRNFAFGAGFKYKSFGVELRYQTAREILTNYKFWRSKYQTLSVILVYSIFEKRS